MPDENHGILAEASPPKPPKVYFTIIKQEFKHYTELKHCRVFLCSVFFIKKKSYCKKAKVFLLCRPIFFKLKDLWVIPKYLNLILKQNCVFSILLRCFEVF